MRTTKEQQAEYLSRALAAYYRTDVGANDPPSVQRSAVERHDGNWHVVLRDQAKRLLACYRIKNDGFLRRLRRLPRTLRGKPMKGLR